MADDDEHWDEALNNEDDFDNCCQYVVNGYIHCSAIGSEECDWCPYYDDIGTKVEVEGD